MSPAVHPLDPEPNVKGLKSTAECASTSHSNPYSDFHNVPVPTWWAVVVSWTVHGVRYERTLAVVSGWAVCTCILAFVRLAGSRGAADRLGRPFRAIVTGRTLTGGRVGHRDVLVARAVVAGATFTCGMAESGCRAVVTTVTGRAVTQLGTT